MSTYLMALGLILAFWLINVLFIKPIRKIKRFSKQFIQKGYKVYTFPYSPLKYPIYQTMLVDSQKEGDPFKTYKQKFASYDILIGNIFTNPGICFLSPQARKQFAKNQMNFNIQKPPFLRKLFARTMGMGLVLSQGQDWKRKRRIISSFFTYQFINSKIPMILQICQRCLSQNQPQNEQNAQTKNKDTFMRISLIDLGTKIFSKVILSLFLGAECLQQKIDGQTISHFLVQLVTDNSVRISQMIPLILGTKFLNLGLTRVDRNINRRIRLLNQWANKYIDKLIAKLNLNSQPSNLLQLLFVSKMKNSEQNYSKHQLINELKTFFIAGTDSTSHLLQMMIYLTVRNKHVYEKAKSQVSELNQDVNCIENLKKMKYIQAIQKQTTRYYGPLPLDILRIAAKDHYFNGVPIEKGTQVQYNSISTHFNPDIYQQPFEFRPERWLNENKEYDPAILTGFGMGPRSCIGQYLAHVESKIVFFSFLKRYPQIRVPDKINLRWKFMNEAENLWAQVSKKAI